MTLGIKVGLNRQSFLDLEQTNAPFVEVWFNINRAGEYSELFAELRRRRCEVGLHFWGQLPDGTSPGFGYPDNQILNASSNVVKQTIDVAARNAFQYVNIHPGSRAIVKIDLDRQDYPYVSAPAPLDQAQQVFLEHVSALNAYAKDRGVLLTVETVCRRVQKTDWYNSASRLKPIDIFQLPVASIQAAAERGVAIANDFAHTATDPETHDPKRIWQFLLRTTQTLAPSTRLIHVGFLVPPYNGTDFHDTLENPLLETNDALPNERQMIELLNLFKNRDDVWILVEPSSRHAQNYALAQKILARV